MPLLARKLLNALDLLWGSLDERERMLVLYAAGYIVVGAVSLMRGRSREQLKREVAVELAGELANELRRLDDRRRVELELALEREGA